MLKSRVGTSLLVFAIHFRGATGSRVSLEKGSSSTHRQASSSNNRTPRTWDARRSTLPPEVSTSTRMAAWRQSLTSWVSRPSVQAHALFQWSSATDNRWRPHGGQYLTRLEVPWERRVAA